MPARFPNWQPLLIGIVNEFQQACLDVQACHQGLPARVLVERLAHSGSPCDSKSPRTSESAFSLIVRLAEVLNEAVAQTDGNPLKLRYAVLDLAGDQMETTGALATASPMR